MSRPKPGERADTTVDVGRLFDLHAPFLLRVVERLAGSGPHVEDVVQEVFLIAHRKRRALEGHTEPRAWLYRTATHVVRHHQRAFARRRRLADAVAAEGGGLDPARFATQGPEERLAARQQSEAIRAIVLDLPLKQREVFVLFELECLEGKEISELLGVPTNTVWTRLHHARKQFKDLWARRTAAADRVTP